MPLLITSKTEIINWIKQQKIAQKTIGFVPTMGALHAGHLNLVRAAKQENDVVVVSIFVNPTQFNNAEDLEKYPQTLNADINHLQNLATVIFAPSETEMYPDGRHQMQHFNLDYLEKTMEGAFRPGHFQGVAHIVNLLFELISPNKAYFGLKDFQQVAVIKKMLELTKKTIEIVALPTARDENGLALSSRNARLNKEQQKEASSIYGYLLELKAEIGLLGLTVAQEKFKEKIHLHSDFVLEYLEIVDAHSLKKLEAIDSQIHTIACVAVLVHGVRLIDNITIF